MWGRWRGGQPGHDNLAQLALDGFDGLGGVQHHPTLRLFCRQGAVALANPLVKCKLIRIQPVPLTAAGLPALQTFFRAQVEQYGQVGPQAASGKV